MTSGVRVRVVGTFPGTTLEKVRARVEAYGAQWVSRVGADTHIVCLGRRFGIGCKVQDEFNAAARLNGRGASITIVHTLDALWAALAAQRPCAEATPLLPRAPRTSEQGFALAF